MPSLELRAGSCRWRSVWVDADYLRGDFASPGGIDCILHGAGEDNATTHGLDANVGPSDKPIEQTCQRRKVALDGDLKRHDLSAVLVDENDVGFARCLADQVSARRGLQYRFHLVRIGDHDLAHFARQLDDHRLVQAERDLTPRPISSLADAQIGAMLIFRQRGRWRDDAAKREASSDKRDERG